MSVVKPDRDSWCTPRWLAESLGEFTLDPCSNGRSHIQAAMKIDLASGGDGLDPARVVPAQWRVFVNPPYSNVTPWIRAFKHARFCFLLKFDTSTAWFAELYRVSAFVAIPRKRVGFEPPPGAKASTQQFPHALFYADERDVTETVKRLSWCWRVNPSK